MPGLLLAVECSRLHWRPLLMQPALCDLCLQAVVELVREYNSLGRGNLAIMMDTKGPGAAAIGAGIV